TPTMIRVRESHVEKMGKVQDVSYEILNVLEFNRQASATIQFLFQGADSVIYEKIARGNDAIKRTTREHLEQFGAAGLRTLCLAYRDLSNQIYEDWNEKFIDAKSALNDREKKLDEVADLIEKELILIGCTAIEDKLQDGVPACIETLSRAGIKIWILTGDKLETAINIAYACSLINNQMKQFVISSETKEVREVEDRADPVETARVIEDTVKRDLEKCLDEVEYYAHSRSELDFALVMFGNDDKMELLCSENYPISIHLVALLQFTDSALLQVTSLIKVGARKITLAIGDGANDVSMIQAAHVGVGCKCFTVKEVSPIIPDERGIKNMFFKWRVLAVWAFFAVYQSIIFFSFTVGASTKGQNSSGKVFGLWDVGTMAFTCVVITVNLRLMLASSYITKWHNISVAGSILAWFLFIFIYSGIMTRHDRQENIYFVIYVLMSTGYFWLSVLLVPLVALIGDFLFQGIQRRFAPYDYQIIQEKHWNEPDERRRPDNETASNFDTRSSKKSGNCPASPSK
ncbi:hypothetical protein KI387_007575, partial [Taxus chinensis]